MIGLNSKFSVIYENLPFGEEKKQRYSDDFDSPNSSLKLLDGKYGNFCYCPEKFLVVSVGKSSVNPNFPSRRGIGIHFYAYEREWYFRLGISILFNYDHKRDSLEKSSSVLARSAIKRIASFDTVEDIYQYLEKLSESRREFCNR